MRKALLRTTLFVALFSSFGYGFPRSVQTWLEQYGSSSALGAYNRAGDQPVSEATIRDFIAGKPVELRLGEKEVVSDRTGRLSRVMQGDADTVAHSFPPNTPEFLKVEQKYGVRNARLVNRMRLIERQLEAASEGTLAIIVIGAAHAIDFSAVFARNNLAFVSVPTRRNMAIGNEGFREFERRIVGIHPPDSETFSRYAFESFRTALFYALSNRVHLKGHRLNIRDYLGTDVKPEGNAFVVVDGHGSDQIDRFKNLPDGKKLKAEGLRRIVIYYEGLNELKSSYTPREIFDYTRADIRLTLRADPYLEERVRTEAPDLFSKIQRNEVYRYPVQNSLYAWLYHLSEVGIEITYRGLEVFDRSKGDILNQWGEAEDRAGLGLPAKENNSREQLRSRLDQYFPP